MKNNRREIRNYAASELRGEPCELSKEERADASPGTLSGVAIPFNAETVIAGQFRELVRPGAFKKTLRESDQVALWQHDMAKPLGRKSEGTVEIREEKDGVPVEVKAPDTSWGRDAVVSIGRGDVQGMSFGFEVVREIWTEAKEGVLALREILEAKLHEVSFVTFPAYPTTEAEARSILQANTAQRDTPAPTPASHPGAASPSMAVRRRQWAQYELTRSNRNANTA